ncbi:hypothetical protein SAMN05428978_102215 [Nitrosomonas sp. Nm34]|nr:hypothetical protein SAMN05428978_102215 [Nitrosomonas sp. Nm34]
MPGTLGCNNHRALRRMCTLPSGAMRYIYCILPAKSNMTLSALLAVLLKLSTACRRVMFGLDENSF